MKKRKIISNILGIFSILTSFLIIVSLPISIIGLKIIKKCESKNKLGKILNITGLTLSIIIFSIFVVMVKKELDKENKEEKIVSCEKLRGGKKNLGFIDLPNNWYEDTNSTDKHVTFYSDEKDELISIYNSGDVNLDKALKEMLALIKENGGESINVTNQYVDKYKSTLISFCYPKENVCLKNWIFEDEQGICHYIGIQSPNKDSKIFDNIKTYRLNK